MHAHAHRTEESPGACSEQAHRTEEGWLHIYRADEIVDSLRAPYSPKKAARASLTDDPSSHHIEPS